MKEIRWLREARRDRLADEVERRFEERGLFDDSRFDFPDAQPFLMVPEGDGWVEVRPPSVMQLRRWLPHAPSRTTARLAEALSTARLSSPEALRLVRAAVRDGLCARLGRRLETRDEPVLAYLVGRSDPPRGVRACESCRLVFEAPRARYCPTCRHGRPRPLVGGHHETVTVGGLVSRWHMEVVQHGRSCRLVASLVTAPRKPSAVYTGVCSACGADFAANDARTRLCDACGSPPGRVRRSRARKGQRLAENA
jgi:Zn finger protein HypA/HybF involved in hydrogenase expression